MLLPLLLPCEALECLPLASVDAACLLLLTTSPKIPMPSIPPILPTMPSQALESLPMLMPVSGAAYSWYIKLPTSPKILCHKFLKCLQESKQIYLSKGCHTRGHTWERADKVHWGFTWCQTDKDVRREVQAHRISHSSRRTRGETGRDRGVDKEDKDKEDKQEDKGGFSERQGSRQEWAGSGELQGRNYLSGSLKL